jgi:hypothetical protein
MRWRASVPVLWLGALCVAAVASVQHSRLWIQAGLPRTPPMCAGLPRYEAFAGIGDARDVLTFATADQGRLLERHFCAQYVLVPTTLELLGTLDPTVLLAHVRRGPVLVDGVQEGARTPSAQASIDQVLASGEVLVRRENRDGLLVLEAKPR